MTGIRDIGAPNAVISGLGSYNALITVAQAGADLGLPAADVLRITVTVTPPAGDAVVLDGYRARYAPRTSQ
jgi:MSHA pilin protein MshD